MLSSLLDKLSSAIIVLDQRNIVVACNRPAHMLLGSPASPIDGESFFDLCPDYTDSRVATAIHAALDLGLSSYISARLREQPDPQPDLNDTDPANKDAGTAVPAKAPVTDTRPITVKRDQLQFHISAMRDDNGQKLCMLEINDASASLEREAVLRKIARQQGDRASEVEAVISNSGDAILIFTSDGTIQQINARARSLLALDHPANQHLQNIRDMTQAIAGDNRSETPFGNADGNLHEIDLYRQDGSIFPAEVVLTHISQSHGGLYILNFRDITTRRLNQLALEKANKDAELALAAKSRFLAIMSHEIRTPLSGVMGTIDILHNKLQDKEALKHVTFMESAADALNTIINDILDYSKLERHQVELVSQPFSINDVVRESLEINKDTAKNGNIALRDEIDPSLTGQYLGDRVRIRQILLNLISNALKFTRKGHVTLSVSPVESKDKPHLIRFSVTDTGIGIEENRQRGLFEEFTQANADISQHFGGTGLGLAICRSLITLMGGDITVSSMSGKGSTFWFDIPLPPFNDKSPQALASSQHTEPAGLRGLKILVVEDSKFNQLILRELLNQAGHDVTLLENGQEAVDHLKDPDNLHDMIFMDIVMPELGGLEATLQIRQIEERERRIANVIVALSANAFEEDQQEALLAGMNSFATKPVTMQKLKTAIAGVADLILERQRAL